MLSSRCSSGVFSRSEGLVIAVTSGHQLGTADRKKLLGSKADSVEPAPIAVAVPDRNIDLFRTEVDMMHRCGNPQIDAGMGLGKPAEP